MVHRKLVRVGAVAASCAAVGAGAGVLGSAFAASSNAPQRAGHARAAAGKRQHRHRALLRRAVHADFVVATKGGKFAQGTLDRGFVTAVSGAGLTLREGTRKATYKTVTLTIPANARVRDNRRRARLSDVQPGQRAAVIQGPRRTVVRAHDARRR